MSDLVERVAFALWHAEAERAAPNVAKHRTMESFCTETNESDRLSWFYLAKAALAAMQTDTAPALKPAVEVWRNAKNAGERQPTPTTRDQAAAAVIEADRAAIIAAKDAEIAALKGQLAQQAEDNADLPTIAYFAGSADARDRLAALKAHADALAAVLRHRGGPLCPARYYGDEQCTCGVSDALRAYEEFRRG